MTILLVSSLFYLLILLSDQNLLNHNVRLYINPSSLLFIDYSSKLDNFYLLMPLLDQNLPNHNISLSIYLFLSLFIDYLNKLDNFYLLISLSDQNFWQNVNKTLVNYIIFVIHAR